MDVDLFTLETAGSEPHLDMNALRVAVVAGDPLVRAALAALLDRHPACQVVGQTAGAGRPEIEIAVFRPEVVVWDVGWNPPTELASDLAQVTDRYPTIVLLPDTTLADATRAAGAQGLLLRDTDLEPLVAALLAASAGLVVLDPSLAPQPPRSGSGPVESLPERLTPRETEVLQLLADGLSNRQIAVQLEISPHTVKFHVNAILGKLDAQSRTEAVVRATRLGLVIL